MRAALAVVLMASVVLGASSPSWAAESPTQAARKYFKQGREYYQQARYPEAIEQFEQAYRAKPHGVIFFNLAQCYEKLGDVPNAIKHYRDYLRDIPNAEDRPTVETVIANLERRAKENAQQALVIRSTPTGADFRLDSEPRGKTPFEGEVKSGSHLIELKLEGYEPATRLIVTSADQPTELEVPLKRSPTNLNVAATQVPTPRSTELRSSHSRKWMWASFGISGIATSVALIAGASAEGQAATLRATKFGNQQEVQSLHDSARARAKVSNVFYAIGGTAAATGLAFFFLEGRF